MKVTLDQKVYIVFATACVLIALNIVQIPGYGTAVFMLGSFVAGWKLRDKTKVM